ncbi:putative glucan endo-1,3-alpha-glucosidase agn1 precursor [Thermoascus aurantiacus ATCC 26904]
MHFGRRNGLLNLALFSAVWASLIGLSAADLKGVFAHYMVGSMTQQEAVTDVTDAKGLGIDAFALNVQSTADWATSAVQYLFDAARDAGFKLFFSFDMYSFKDPSEFLPLLTKYANHTAYYKHDNKPFVSTFKGGASTYTFGQNSTNAGWSVAFRQAAARGGVNPFFVPNFDDASGYPAGFFDSFPVVDGVFGWETAWPAESAGVANVSDTVDHAVLDAARAANKVYMMPLSSLQFKDLGGQNWYRIGELNYAQRIEQVLELQPDFVEIVTWNDAGESHYIGNFWPEQIAGTDIGNYTNGFDHKGWQQLLPPFIQAYKSGNTDVTKLYPPSGKSAAGAMWYRPVLTTSDCPQKPSGWQSAQDAVNYAVLLPEGSDGFKINVYSNNEQIGSFPAGAGMNARLVLGLQAGPQRLEVVDGSGTVVASANGTKEVQTSADLCNYNYVVVGLS